MNMQQAITKVADKEHKARTPQQVERDNRLLQCLQILTRSAENGQACPTNADLSDMLGYGAPNKASGVVNLLEVMGFIKVERGRRNRVVTIMKTGQKTAGVVVKSQSSNWTEDEDAILMDGMSEGLTFPQVAAILRKTHHCCSSRFYRLAAQLGEQAQ